MLNEVTERPTGGNVITSTHYVHVQPKVMNSPTIAWAIFLSYFLSIFILFGIVIRSIWHTWADNASKRASFERSNHIHFRGRLFSILAVASLLHTWFCMLPLPLL